MPMTIREAQRAYKVRVEPHHDAEALIPIFDTLQFQGDVAIIPANCPPAVTPIPPDGVAAVRGDVGGHPHVLIGAGCFDADGAIMAGLVRLGTLTVPAGEVAYLAHEEHGYSGIGPGTYELRRQRELRDAEIPIAD